MPKVLWDYINAWTRGYRGPMPYIMGQYFKTPGYDKANLRIPPPGEPAFRDGQWVKNAGP